MISLQPAILQEFRASVQWRKEARFPPEYINRPFQCLRLTPAPDARHGFNNFRSLHLRLMKTADVGRGLLQGRFQFSSNRFCGCVYFFAETSNKPVGTPSNFLVYSRNASSPLCFTSFMHLLHRTCSGASDPERACVSMLSHSVFGGYLNTFISNDHFFNRNDQDPLGAGSFSCSMISQNWFSLSTLWTLLQPGSASGNTVGLFIPGNNAMIS